MVTVSMATAHHLLLHGAELHPDDELRLGGHVLEDVGLQPPQHVGPQHVVELLDLVLLGDVRKLLQEAVQVAVGERRGSTVNTQTIAQTIRTWIHGEHTDRLTDQPEMLVELHLVSKVFS